MVDKWQKERLPEDRENMTREIACSFLAPAVDITRFADTKHSFVELSIHLLVLYLQCYCSASTDFLNIPSINVPCFNCNNKAHIRQLVHSFRFLRGKRCQLKRFI